MNRVCILDSVIEVTYSSGYITCTSQPNSGTTITEKFSALRTDEYYFSDSDGDGLNDLAEVALGTPALNPDQDQDGFNDLIELNLGTNPRRFNSPEEAFSFYGGKKTNPNPLPGDDADSDGLSDSIELAIGSNPNKTDSDGDGINDFLEYIINTSPTDRGSQYKSLSTEVCSEWNGFLGGMGNIMEHVNMSTEVLYVYTSIYDALGNIKDEVGFSIPPGAQFDILVHDMDGRELDAYGKVCSTHSGQPGDLDGRMVYYKSDQSDGFEFAYPLPYINGIAGNQYVTLNSYNKSYNPLDDRNIAANWIQITNLESSPQAGVITFFDNNGTNLGYFYLELEAEGRFDMSGHQFGEVTGLVEWAPVDEAALFHVRNARYLSNSFGGFDTAYQLEAKPGGSGEVLAVALESSDDAVIEISNTSLDAITVNIQYNSDSHFVTKEVELPPLGSSQLHLETEISERGQNEAVFFSSSSPESLIANVVMHKRDPFGSIVYSYGVDALEPFGDTLRGSYNTFLNQGCTLQLVNASSSNEDIALFLTKATGDVIAPQLHTVPARGALSLDICSEDQDDTYGVVTVLTEKVNNIYAYLVRNGMSSSYKFSTPVRQ